MTFIFMSLLWACGDEKDADTSTEETQEDSAENEETEDTASDSGTE